MSLLNASMLDWIINKSLAYRGINALSQLAKQRLSQFEACTHFEFTFQVYWYPTLYTHTSAWYINAAHCWLLTQASLTAISHFDVIMDLWRLTFSHALKNTLTNHTQTLQLEEKKKKSILKQWQREKCRSVRSCGFGMVTWLTLVFYYHPGKIASLSFCPGAGISVHCLVLAYQSYTSVLLSMWPNHLMRYNKMWLLWISCVLCHASLSWCSALRNFFWYAFQHIFSRPI